MSETWEESLRAIRSRSELTVVLAGNPNVGKSSIFNYLTGLGVITANYPGKTVEMNMATTSLDGLSIGVIDLPGTYSIGGLSEDQWVARRGLLETSPDAVICMIDATNLSRNLYMVLQLKDLGLPVVVGLNLTDRLKALGKTVDEKRLSGLLGGVPVVRTVAVTGKGVDELLRAAVSLAGAGVTELAEAPLHYGHDIDEPLDALAASIAGRPGVPAPYGLGPRALAIALLEGDGEVAEAFRRSPQGEEVLAEAAELRLAIMEEHGEPAELRVARERHGLAGAIAMEVEQKAEGGRPFSERLWDLSTSPVTGLPILAAVLAAVFALLFSVGGLLSLAVDYVWAAFFSPVIRGSIGLVAGHGVIGRTLFWGFDSGISAALSVGISYVLVFYLIFAFLEDSGYLNSAAFLLDRLMHRFGLHGRAIIPMIAGAGCNVPAIIGTRVLATRRERIIASALIVFIPCSARTAVILGSVSIYVGWLAALSIFLITLGVALVVGLALNRIMPGETSGLVMEMFPILSPRLRPLLKKTFSRFRSFIVDAAPVIIIGSLVLGFLYETGYIWWFTRPLRPVIQGWLGLPAVAGIALIFAVLRKEMALQLLLALAIVKYGQGVKSLPHFMDARQIYVYALVATLYFPCLSTVSVLARELGWKAALSIMSMTVVVALLIGGVAFRVIGLFGLL